MPSVKEAPGDQVVLHVRTGKLLKGELCEFSLEEDRVRIRLTDDSSSTPKEIKISDLKAIYFVRTLGGDKAYQRKRYFKLPKKRGDRIMIRFKDREILCGFIEGDFPWKDGFMKQQGAGPKGFYMYPADAGGNNTMIFVMVSSVEDIRRL